MPAAATDKNYDPQSSLLKECRDNFAWYHEEWHDPRQEADTDMRYISGDPWDPEERAIREDADRPCMAWDELSQYINQLVNDPKQNKRAIKVDPRGAGANDKTAEYRGNLIREIETNSKAQYAYTTAFQGACERSYGYFRIGKRFVTVNAEAESSADAFNQELYIGRIPNPDTVLFDPNFKEIDASDAMGCFVMDTMRRTDFKQKYPKAKITDFSSDLVSELNAEKWFTDKLVTVAEWWRVTIEQKTLHLFEGKEGPTVFYEDELPAGFDLKESKRQRKIQKRIVTQYITNGIEILDETKIEIPWIPIVPVFGKELYINEGGRSVRKLFSLVRLARDPYMSYCYYRSQEAEEAGMTPRSPFVGYSGQFETHKEEWARANKVPQAYLQVDPVTDASSGQVLPLPTRPAFSPNFQAYEIACEAARRGIMSAMGISPLPTAAQRNNEKSGKALQQIESQEDQGSFHFIDNYHAALEHAGRILDSWIPFVYDTKREVGMRKPDGSQTLVTVNDPENIGPDGKPEHIDLTSGDHSVTISVGPSFESQREEASDFLDTLIQNLQQIPAPPPALAKLLALTIRLKRLGPLGEEMADVISPPEDQQQKDAAAQAGQQKLAEQQQIMAEMQKELQKLQLEKAGKVVDNQFKVQIQEMKNGNDEKLQQLQNDIKVLTTLISAKTQRDDQEYEMYRTFWQENHQAAHEAGMQAADQQHEAEQAAAAQAAMATAGDQMGGQPSGEPSPGQ